MNIIHRDGVYQSADGRYAIEYGIISESFCDCPESLCPHPGGQMDVYGWWVWDNRLDDYAFDHHTFESFREARAALQHHLDTQPKARVRFPRPKPK